MSITSGFYIPSNVAQGFVKNIKANDGTYKYDVDTEGNIYSSDAHMEAQAAIQSLNKTYSNVINDAYTNYLNSKRSIMSSDIGQGYKEAYVQQQEQALQQSMAQASMNAAEARQTLGTSLVEADLAVNQQYQQEVNYMNTVAANLDKYLEYAKGLRATTTEGAYDPEGKTYLSDYEQTQTLENMYDILFNLQPTGYKTADDKVGQNFLDWTRDQIKTAEDQAWFDWLSMGGYEQFKQGVYNTYGENFTTREKANMKSEALANIPNLDLHWTDYGYLDFGENANDKIKATKDTVNEYVTNLGLSEDAIKEVTGGLTIDQAIDQIADIGNRMNSGFTFEEIFSNNRGANDLLLKLFGQSMFTIFKGVNQGNTQAAVEDIYNKLMQDLANKAEQ